MGQTIGNAFGKKDPFATNDMLNGQVVATGTQGAQTVRDPNQGLSDLQARNRKLTQVGLTGLGALASPQAPQAQQAPINFAPQQQDYSAYFQKQRNPFFGY
jgi:hypothetical protein